MSEQYQGGLIEPISSTFNAYATPEPVKFPQRFPPDITVYQDDTLDQPADPATCPHCPCTQTTECCYCDGTRTPLEDS